MLIVYYKLKKTTLEKKLTTLF